ncbi:MAG: hypothetical protein JJ895_00690 [Balneolaceae bacterium]|nr:hypothetical protein [Balneolaceae bacterium]
MGRNTLENRAADANEKNSDVIKIKLIDRFLIWGAIFATCVFVIPVIAGVSDSSNIDLAADTVNIILLFGLYAFRKKVAIKAKTFCIIITVYSFFLSNLYQHGLYSSTIFIIVFIPFLGILIFNFRQAIWMYLVAIFSYTIIGYLYINGIIDLTLLDPAVNNPVRWINTGIVLSLVSIIVSMFVYSYNTYLLSVIDEKNILL